MDNKSVGTQWNDLDTFLLDKTKQAVLSLLKNSDLWKCTFFVNV